MNSNDDDVNNVSDMINFISLENRKKNVLIGDAQEYEENNQNKSNLFSKAIFSLLRIYPQLIVDN
ncbi:hypothetical protein PFDG_04973 [Plasmodium falciparum Dd2]|uniref:Uncharacterized protein n=1 Tax=Plasmodium falciparum (isolate Dd2) TaxID=57267 RepID=A0A0L7M9E9_PLAF4|nr:hypothetical protein PFDG_04973 [Plasmodium falciparum Dd2]